MGGGWFFQQSLQGSQVLQEFLPGGVGTSLTSTGQQTAEPRATSSPQQLAPSGTVIARIADLPINRASTFTMPNSKDPGVLIHLPDDRFVAFSSICTHMGCRVGYNSTSKRLECPCHDAIFDPTSNAEVVAGPAPRPLAPINIHVNADGTITVE